MTKRFRRMRGKMMVISPENEVQVRPVDVVYDKANDAFGILLIGDTQLRGYSFFVGQEQLRSARDSGAEVDVLTIG